MQMALWPFQSTTCMIYVFLPSSHFSLTKSNRILYKYFIEFRHGQRTPKIPLKGFDLPRKPHD